MCWWASSQASCSFWRITTQASACENSVSLTSRFDSPHRLTTYSFNAHFISSTAFRLPLADPDLNLAADESIFCCAEEQPQVDSIHDYLLHIYEIIECEGEDAIIAPFAYICRLQNTYALRLTPRNMHR